MKDPFWDAPITPKQDYRFAPDHIVRPEHRPVLCNATYACPKCGGKGAIFSSKTWGMTMCPHCHGKCYD